MGAAESSAEQDQGDGQNASSQVTLTDDCGASTGGEVASPLTVTELCGGDENPDGPDEFEEACKELGELVGRNLSTIWDDYGGEFPWVGASYKLKVERGISPLQWLNSLTKNLVSLESLVMTANGGFRRPVESQSLFPLGGLTLRWRWDSSSQRIIIDFWKGNELLRWRWDELKPCKELRFPSTAPDLVGVGHVGNKSFTYWLISRQSKDEFNFPSFQSLENVSYASTVCQSVAQSEQC